MPFALEQSMCALEAPDGSPLSSQRTPSSQTAPLICDDDPEPMIRKSMAPMRPSLAKVLYFQLLT